MDSKLEFDYEETHRQFILLADIRFKLFAFVPLLSFITMALLTSIARPETAFAIGVLGVLLTVVIGIYGLRNAQLYNAAARRAQELEKLLDLRSVTEDKKVGGLFNERPERYRRFVQ